MHVTEPYVLCSALPDSGAPVDGGGPHFGGFYIHRLNVVVRLFSKALAVESLRWAHRHSCRGPRLASCDGWVKDSPLPSQFAGEGTSLTPVPGQRRRS